LYDLFMNVLIVLHTFRERKLLSSRFGIIFISSIEKVPKWMFEVLALFVNLEILTKAEFINQDKLPFTCVSQALLMDTEHAELKFSKDDIRECLKFIRHGMLAHEWLHDDPRKIENFLVHFAREERKEMWTNFAEIESTCVTLHAYCRWFYYDEITRELFFQLTKVNVYVFDHGHLGLHSLFFHPGTSIVEISHPDDYGNVPSWDFQQWAEDQHVNYFRYVSEAKSYPDEGYKINIPKFREVFDEALKAADTYMRRRPTLSFNEAVTHNRHKHDVIDRTLARVEEEQIEGYEVRKFYGNPELTYENFTGTIYPPTTKSPGKRKNESSKKPS